MPACLAWMAALAWRASLGHRDPKVTEAAPVRRESEAKMVWGCPAPPAHLVPLDRSSLCPVKINPWWLFLVQWADQATLASRVRWDRKETRGQLVPRVSRG